MASITCNCRATVISLSTQRPRMCYECCCVDCFQKNACKTTTTTRSDLATRQRAPTLVYFENRLRVTKGHIAFEKLREGAASTNMVCKACQSVLCVDNPAYQAKVVLVFRDWATLENYNPIPATIRWNIKDWSECEIEKLSPLPSIWVTQDDKLEGDGVSLFTTQSTGSLFQECQKVCGYESFQSLLEGHEIKILDLAEDPRSFRLKNVQTCYE